MITTQDFNKKQVAFVFFNDGEKMSFGNDNLVIKDKDGKIKFQCTCYRLFMVFAVGHFSITSVVLEKAKKFGFFIAMMTTTFRLYGLVGAEKDGNTLLKRKQYNYNGILLGKHIIENKISNQTSVLKNVRDKSDAVKDAINHLEEYYSKIKECETINEIMAYEGMASKVYFKNHFNNILWSGRQPRVKRDSVNAVLDLGYTLLFTFIDAILESFGFDTFCGVLHRQFYMRKSLTCDIVEPFRPIIDVQIKKSINLKQINDDDFLKTPEYRLKWECAPKYINFLMETLIKHKDDIFLYIRDYCRAFMKGVPEEEFPLYNVR